MKASLIVLASMLMGSMAMAGESVVCTGTVIGKNEARQRIAVPAKVSFEVLGNTGSVLIKTQVADGNELFAILPQKNSKFKFTSSDAYSVSNVQVLPEQSDGATKQAVTLKVLTKNLETNRSASVSGKLDCP